jgi:hypothetical protein
MLFFYLDVPPEVLVFIRQKIQVTAYNLWGGDMDEIRPSAEGI